MTKSIITVLIPAMLAVAFFSFAANANKFSYDENFSINGYTHLQNSKQMSHFIYDFDSFQKISTYIGIGAGAVHVKSKKSLSVNSKDHDNESEIVPAYQIITGLSYTPESKPSVQLNLGYGYSATVGNALHSENELYNRQEYEINGHSMAAGLKFNF